MGLGIRLLVNQSGKYSIETCWVGRSMLSQLSVFQVEGLTWSGGRSEPAVSLPGIETHLVWWQMLSQLAVFQVERLTWSIGRY